MGIDKIHNYKEFLNDIKYLSSDDIKIVKKACDFAYEKHLGQTRMTGEEYINHPINVARILTSIYADSDTLVASILHDTLEDTNTTKDEIEEMFGKTILKLVDGVTKINNINLSTENEYLTAYYKKIIVGMSEDVRVIIIKLADRLDNMRTLYVHPEEKQKLKARETLEILAPIAHRLGMSNIKSELEDLSLKYLKPEVYYDILEKLNNTKLEREQSVEEMMKEVSNLLKANNIKHEIKGRAKSVYSIYRKLDKGKNFSNIYDILAIRILVEKEQECYLALGLIHSKYKPLSKRFKDYIAMPKPNLYQTLHTTVFGLNGNLFEIQIRTYKMDEVAENGIASHWAYKENKNAAVEMQNITEKKLQFYKSIIDLNEEKISNEEYITTLKNEVLNNNNIYVFTPKGDVIELPKGSTPIDFAYKVHTEVGDKMTGAIVNEKIVPLSTELNNNDIVKVITNSSSKGPSLEWLNIAHTSFAKSKIKTFFNKNNKEENIIKGKDLLEKELKRKKVSQNDFYKEENINKVLKEFKEESLDDLYFDIGTNKYSPKSVIEIRKQNEKKKDVIIKPKNINKDIIVSNNKNIKTHIANCCLPIPGDRIIGYITKTNGIAVHRKLCSVVEKNNDRVLEVKWNDNINNKYFSEVIIYSNTSDNIISKIAIVAEEVKINIENINLINKTGKNIYKIRVLVKNKEELEKFINTLLQNKYINKVERLKL